MDKHNKKVDYGKILKKYREENGLTQDEVSDLIHCSERTVSLIETGVTTRPHEALRLNIMNLIKGD